VVRRSGFTLIELIFAIVIIAITVLSLPMMNQIISKGIDSNIKQEAIFAAATELNEATTAHWDENSLAPDSSSLFARVIDIDDNCDNNTSSPRYRLMPGHIEQLKHRRCLNDSTTDPANESNTAVEALEDKAHGYQLIFLNPTPSAEGSKDEYYSQMTVVVVKDNVNFGGASDKNIKKVTVTITDSDKKIISSLKAYSANIGEVDFHKRTY
jgi:prepilin-type N-terminal cleavage/methylation domain-containing protein